MRKTKIICTIGPASESEEKLRELMLAGMNVARFNFSHGSHKEQLVKYNRVLKVRKELGLPVATLLDTKGPEIRLRDFEGGKVELVSGQQFVLTTEEIMGTAERATISYKNLKNDINVGKTILIDDGLIEMTVEEIKGEAPSPLDVPAGCPFRGRCPKATERCAQEKPRLHQIGADHEVACHLFGKEDK